MNVSMSAALLSIDVAGGSQPAAEAGADGEGFGLAVKDAAHKHDGKRAGAKDATSRSKGHGDADADETANDNDAAVADGSGGISTPAELLGRLLGLTAPAALPETQPRQSEGQGSGDAAPDNAADGALQERIVISTVADLAGSAEGNGGGKGVSLRVTGMETHFEPRLDGAALIEAADRPASVAAAERANEQTVATPKQAFTEILQRLGGQTVGTRSDGDIGMGDSGTPVADDRADGETDRDGRDPKQPGRLSRTTERAHAANPATRASVAEVSDRPDARTKGPSTGEIVNAQIAEHIVDAFASSDEAKGGSETARSNAGSQQVLRMTAGGAALKTLSIQLEPQNLGRVDVAMRLVDGRLQVELAASEPSTAAALAGDRHGLRKILEHAGFALDDAAITIVARDMGQGTSVSTPTSGGSDGGRPSADGSSTFNRPSDERSSGERRQPDQRRQPAGDGERRNELSSRTKAKTGSIYL